MDDDEIPISEMRLLAAPSFKMSIKYSNLSIISEAHFHFPREIDLRHDIITCQNSLIQSRSHCTCN